MRLMPLLSFALALRTLAAVFMFRNDPHIWFYDQASELTCLARSLLSGRGLSSPFCGSTGPSAFLAPGYPLLVALVYRIFGTASVRAAAMLTGLQVLFGILVVLVVMLVARRLFGNRTAYIAGTLCAVSPTMVWLPVLFWETSLSTLLLTGVLLLTLHCIDRPTSSRWIAMGAYCAFGLFVNPALLLTFAGAGAWAAYKARPGARSAPLLAVGACLVIFSIWPIRNGVVLHAFVPLRSNLGYELWQGNRRESHGLFTKDIYLNTNHREYERYAAMGELPYVREKETLALAAIYADPLRFLRLSLKRYAMFWTALGGSGISWVVIGEITITSLCAATSLIVLIIRDSSCGKLLLIPFFLFPLPYYVTHPDFRFRLLLEPLALLLTAWFVQRCYEKWSFRCANVAY